jgi:hypothetical protein
MDYEFEIRVKIFRIQEVMAVNYFSNTAVNFTHKNSQQLWKLYIHTVVVLQGVFLIHGELEHKSSRKETPLKAGDFSQ